MATTTMSEVRAAHQLIEQLGGSMAEYLRNVLDSKGKESLGPDDLRASLSYALGMLEAGGVEGLKLGFAIETDQQPEIDQEMLAEGRRLAAAGKRRPVTEYLNERRTQRER
jgi:hypothetical protein